MTVEELVEFALDVLFPDYDKEVLFSCDGYAYKASGIKTARVVPVKGCEGTVFQELGPDEFSDQEKQVFIIS